MRDLSRLLRPRTIAVVGGAWAENVALQCRRMNFGGSIWPVNPHRRSMGGVACFASLKDLPHAPDAAFVGVNRHAAVQVVGDLAAMGCGGATCFASGFAEAGDHDLQRQLVAAAAGMPLLGPNCYGVINFLDGALLWPDQHGGRREAAGVAIIGQSSNILINLSSQRRGLPIAYIAAAGNQAQTTMADIARGMLSDKRVRAIGFYVEGIADAADFAAMAAVAEARGVWLAAIKAGKCAASSSAAVSHTAALTGAAEASSAFLRRCNIAEAQTLPELLEILKLLHVRGALPGRNIMSLSCSGGEAGHVADLSVGRNLCWPPPPPPQRAALQKQLGDLVSITNPLDYHTFIWRDAAALQATYAAAFDCANDLTALIYDYPRGDRCDQGDWQVPMAAFMAAAATNGGNAAVVATLPENMPEMQAEKLLAAGIVPLCGISESLAAMDYAAGLYECRQRGGVGDWRPLPVMGGTPQMVGEADAKRWLQKNGVACPAGWFAQTPQAAQAAAPASGMFAVKSLGLAHKTEAGGVRLRVAAQDISATATAMPGGSGFWVEEMIADVVAEVLIGVRRDAVYGATLTVGMGGVQTEVLADSQTLILPATAAEIAAAFQRLRLAPLLCGWRGRPAADMDAVIAVAVAVSALLCKNDNIAEIEINPLLARASGAVAADALITVTGEFLS